MLVNQREIVAIIGISLIVIGIFGGFIFGWLSLADLTSIITAIAGGGIVGLFAWGFKPRFDKQEFANLEIVYDPNDPDQYCFFDQKNDKKYLTVCVENNGNGIARKCKARLKIRDKQGKEYPKTELKFLRWAWKDTTRMTINSHDKEFLNVAFSVEKPVHNMFAFISNPKSINSPENPRIKDGFPIGEYIFTIFVNAEKGEWVERKFKIDVTNNWKEISMQKIEEP